MSSVLEPGAPRAAVYAPPDAAPRDPVSGDAAAPCAECGGPLLGPFCHRCGQRAAPADDLTVGRFARSAAHEVAGTDGRLVRSLWLLVRRPGLLTREFVDGHRRRWTSPVQLFLLASTAYLLYGFGAAMSAVGARGALAAQIADGARRGGLPADAAARLAADPALQGDALYAAWSDMLGWGKFANVVVFAFAAWLLHRRRVRGGLPAATFALHYYAFDFLLFTALAPLLRLAVRLNGGPVDAGWLFAALPLEIAYLAVALRRTFGEGRVATAAKTGALFAVDFLVSSLTGMVALGVLVGRLLAARG